MASEPTLRDFAEQIAKVIREYAESQGWPADSYRLYLKYNDNWSTAHLILVTGNLDDVQARDQWKDIRSLLNQKLHVILQHINMFSLTIRTFKQLEQGRFYAFGPEFIPIEEYFGPRPVA
jgi:hypothetical protein